MSPSLIIMKFEVCPGVFNKIGATVHFPLPLKNAERVTGLEPVTFSLGS
jgi:hypothetical protein